MIYEILNDIKKGVILKKITLNEDYFFELNKSLNELSISVFEEDRISIKENLGKITILFTVAGVISNCKFENIYNEFYKVIIPEEKELLNINSKNDVINLINVEITNIFKELNLYFKINDDDIVDIYHYLFLISRYYNIDFENVLLEAIN
jgi:hypothetical protein